MPDEQQTTPEQQQTPPPTFQPPEVMASQPSPPAFSPPAAPLAPVPAKKSHKKLWIILGASIFVVLALIIAVVIMFMNVVQKSNSDFTKGDTVDKLTTYKDSNSGVSLKIPDGWDVQKTKPDDKTLVRLTIQPPAGSFANAFDEQQVIDLLCQTTSSIMNEDLFISGVTTGVIPGDEAKGLTVSDQSNTTIDGHKAYLYKASKQDDKTRTTYYHSYYMAGSKEVCDTYVLAVTSQSGGALPVESYANEILQSVRSN